MNHAVNKDHKKIVKNKLLIIKKLRKAELREQIHVFDLGMVNMVLPHHHFLHGGSNDISDDINS